MNDPTPTAPAPTPEAPAPATAAEPAPVASPEKTLQASLDVLLASARATLATTQAALAGAQEAHASALAEVTRLEGARAILYPASPTPTAPSAPAPERDPIRDPKPGDTWRTKDGTHNTYTVRDVINNYVHYEWSDGLRSDHPARAWRIYVGDDTYLGNRSNT